MQEENGCLFSSLSFCFTVETYYFSNSHQNTILFSFEQESMFCTLDGCCSLDIQECYCLEIFL